jgi:magnesium chelatase family protein
LKAREVQDARFGGRKGLYCNADMQSKDIKEFCQIYEHGEELLKMVYDPIGSKTRRAITKLGLSAPAYDRILKVSRTIADLAGSERVKPDHVSEAIQYRSLDRNLWMA